MTETDRAPVVLQESGLWFPELGVSLNSYRPQMPAIFLDPDILRQHGRKRGVLAPEPLWNESFPHAKVAKSPLPLDRSINLGETFVRVWTSQVGSFHLAIMGATTVFVCAPGAGVSGEEYEDLGLDPPAWIVWYAGPDCEGDDPGWNLTRVARNWPGASILLYGPEVSKVLGSLDHDLRDRSLVLAAVEQANLF